MKRAISLAASAPFMTGGAGFAAPAGGALKKFAAATNPGIKMHLEMARKPDPGAKSASN